MSTLRLGIVGFGRAAMTHAAAARSEHDLDVVAVCDPSSQARATAARQGYRPYARLDAMLASEDLDAAVVCSPPADHAPLAIESLSHGVHVLAEKPLSVALRQAFEMFAAARTHQRVLLVASKFRHVAAIQRTWSMLHSGALGEPLAFEVNFCTAVDMADRWNAQPERSGGGVIRDNGCHVFDLAAYLFGPIARVHTTLWKPLQQLAVEDAATLRLDAGGVIGNRQRQLELDAAR